MGFVSLFQNAKLILVIVMSEPDASTVVCSAFEVNMWELIHAEAFCVVHL